MIRPWLQQYSLMEPVRTDAGRLLGLKIVRCQPCKSCRLCCNLALLLLAKIIPLLERGSG